VKKTSYLSTLTPEEQNALILQGQKAKTANSERIKKYGFLAPLKAIRAHCLDCQGEGPSWVTNCDQHECPLWPYRMARRPKEKDLLVAQISRMGEVTGHKPLDEARAEES